MPPPKKLDLIPPDLKRQLKALLRDQGFGGIEEATAALNGWLEDEGIPISIGKTAVGNYSQLLKDQAEAYAIADELLAEVGIEEEAAMHRAIMHMIAAQCVKLIADTRDGGGQLDAKALSQLGKMLKDLMSSVGDREKVRADERARIREEEREAMKAKLETAVEDGAIDGATAEKARVIMGFAA